MTHCYFVCLLLIDLLYGLCTRWVTGLWIISDYKYHKSWNKKSNILHWHRSYVVEPLIYSTTTKSWAQKRNFTLIRKIQNCKLLLSEKLYKNTVRKTKIQNENAKKHRTDKNACLADKTILNSDLSVQNQKTRQSTHRPNWAHSSRKLVSIKIRLRINWQWFNKL